MNRKKFTWQHYISILLIGGTLIIFFLYLYPQNRQLESLRKEMAIIVRDLRERKEAIARARREAEILKQLEADYQQVRQQVVLLNERLPEKKEIPRLVQQLSDLSRSFNLELISLRPYPLIEAGDYLRLPLEINLGGSYRSLGEYLKKVEGLQRLVSLEEMEIRGEPQELPRLVIRLMLVAYAQRKEGEIFGSTK